MAEDTALIAQITRLGEQLDKRAARLRLLDRYYEGKHPIPPAVTQAKAVKAYELLMGMARSNWPKLIVDSVEERLAIQAVNFNDKTATDRFWKIWQANGLDSDSGLAHQAALTGGHSFVIVWADDDDPETPEICPEHGSTVIIEYADGSRRERAAALRRWHDGTRWYATLFLPDAIYKFQATSEGVAATPSGDGAWERREVEGEDWPLDNPLNTVPVVELAVNRTLRPTRYGTGAGEFQGALEHVDRINYTTFSALAAMTWSGFPLRAQIGDPIVYDDDKKPLAPFDVAQDRIIQIENPDGKLVQLPEADLTKYDAVLETHIRHLAAITKTPAHYLLGEMVNLSADAIRAAEAALISKIRRHQRAFGEAWEEVARLALRVLNPDDPTANDPMIEVQWVDPESRSMAERADASSKLQNILPWQALASKILGASPREISEWQSQRAADGLSDLIAKPIAPREVVTPQQAQQEEKGQPPTPAPVPGNGNPPR